MTLRISKIGRPFGLLLSLLLVIGIANGRERGRKGGEDFQRFSISLGGGFGFSEAHHGIADLKSEFQLSFSSRVRLSLGLGYMSDFKGHDRARDMEGWMKGDRQGQGGFRGPVDERQGPVNDFRIVSLSLNVYYLVPVGRDWNVFMSGGPSYYFGSFQGGPETQKKNAWGGQAGLGFEFRIAERLHLVAEGGYRFVEFKGLKRPQPRSNPLDLGRPWLIDKPITNWNNRDIYARMRGLLRSLPGWGRPGELQTAPFSMNLNGFSFRLGLKFGF